MKAIIDMLTGFFGLIEQLVQFVFDLLGDLVFVLGLLTQFIVEIPTYFFWLPSVVGSIVIIGFSIVVIYMILNRK